MSPTARTRSDADLAYHKSPRNQVVSGEIEGPRCPGLRFFAVALPVIDRRVDVQGHDGHVGVVQDAPGGCRRHVFERVTPITDNPRSVTRLARIFHTPCWGGRGAARRG